MKTCNADARSKDLHGPDRKAFMKQCLSGKAKRPRRPDLKAAMAMRARFAFPLQRATRDHRATAGPRRAADSPSQERRPGSGAAERGGRAAAPGSPWRAREPEPGSEPSAVPVTRVAVGVLEEIDPQADAQRQVPRVRKHREDAVGRRRVVVQDADEPP